MTLLAPNEIPRLCRFDKPVSKDKYRYSTGFNSVF